MEYLKKLFAPVDMTVGKPWENILIFTVPMLIGNIAQQLYNTVDSVVVGNFVGDMDLSEAQLAYFFYHSLPDPLGNTEGDGNRNISALDFTEVGSNTIFSTFALANWVGAAEEAAAPFEGFSPETVY